VELNQSLYALDSTTIDGRLDERFTAPSTRKVSKIDIGFVAFSAMKKNSAQTDRPTTGARGLMKEGKKMTRFESSYKPPMFMPLLFAAHGTRHFEPQAH